MWVNMVSDFPTTPFICPNCGERLKGTNKSRGKYKILIEKNSLILICVHCQYRVIIPIKA